MPFRFRDYAYLLATAVIWTAGGCTALNIPRNPQSLADRTVYDPMPTYHADFVASASEIRPVTLPDDREDWRAFHEWRDNADPRAPWAFVRKMFRESK